MNFTKRLKSFVLKTPVKAGVSPSDLEEIKNPALVALVKKAMTLVVVKHINTDGYDTYDEQGGGAGVELHFEGKEGSMVNYGAKALDFKAIQGLNDFMKAASAKGFECEVLISDEQDFVLVILGS